MTQPTEYENLSYNAPDGSIFGRTSTDRVGFWGAVPVARPVTISTSLVSTTVGQSTSTAAVATTSWGFASQPEILNFINAVSTMHYAMKQLGLIAGGVQTALTASSTTFEVVDYGSTDGAQFGRTASELISFYGATPVARSSWDVSTSDVSTTSTNSTSTGGSIVTSWAFLTSAEVTVICSAVSTMQLAMKQLGLIA